MRLGPQSSGMFFLMLAGLLVYDGAQGRGQNSPAADTAQKYLFRKGNASLEEYLNKTLF